MSKIPTKSALWT